MRRLELDSVKEILKLTKASQEEVMKLIDLARLEDNLVVERYKFENANKRRAFNKRVQKAKELEIIKVVDIKLSENSKYYPYFMISPKLFPPTNKRAARLLWSGY